MVQKALAQVQIQAQIQKQIAGGLLQRKCDGCRKKKPLLQRAAAGPSPDTVSPIVHEVLRSSGQPLDTTTRALMEPRFGRDFSNVQVHADAHAAASAQAVNALAYTVGRDVVFGLGQYAPHTSVGQRLLAHELTHVIQQGNTAWTGDALQIGASDTPQEREATNASQPVTAAPSGVLQRDQSPDLGGLYLRIGENGRIEVLAGTPDLPITGPLGVGFRCQNRRCQLVGGQDPSDVKNRTYTAQEAIDVLGRGTGAAPSSPTPSGSGCPSDRRIPHQGLCCPADMVWDGSGSACVPRSSSSPQLCLPAQMTPRGTCCPIGERWDYLANRCAPPSPSGQLGAQGPQLTVPPLSFRGQPRIRFGTIESSTFDNFRSDDATVPSQHNPALDHLASLLNNYRNVEVHIEGHTDSTADEAHNEQLAINRANAMKAALVARNVENPGRLQTVGFGERQLRASPERTEADKAGNRRVEVWYHIPPSEGIGSSLQLRPPFLTPPTSPGP